MSETSEARLRYRVKVINGEDPTFALAVVDAVGAGDWAREQAVIGGVAWDADGADFAVAVVPSEPDLPHLLASDGYDVDGSDFTYQAP